MSIIDWSKQGLSKDKLRFDLHVLVNIEGNAFTAHCLEFDLVADGNNLKEAVESICTSIDMHIEYCINTNNFDNLFRPAPKEYWNKFYLCSKKRKALRPTKSSPEYPVKKINIGQFAYA